MNTAPSNQDYFEWQEMEARDMELEDKIERRHRFGHAILEERDDITSEMEDHGNEDLESEATQDDQAEQA